MGGRASRAKGARGERMLRDELRRNGWEDVSREGWKQVKGGQGACDDVVGRPPGYQSTIAFENKFYATGFDKYYTLIEYFKGQVACAFPEGDALFAALDPNTVINNVVHMPLAQFPTAQQKALKSLVKKCRDWAGNAHILSLKQNAKPFLYVRFRR